MTNLRPSLIAVLISSLILNGCQTDSRSVAVTEYRPHGSTAERKAPDSEIFVLWRWYPLAPAATEQLKLSNLPRPPTARQFPVEIEQVYLERGAPVGFRRHNGELISVTGATTKPIEEAHYIWKTLPGSSRRSASHQPRNFLTVVAGVVLIVIGIAALAYLSNTSNDDDACDTNGAPPSRQHSPNQTLHPVKPRAPSTRPA